MPVFADLLPEPSIGGLDPIGISDLSGFGFGGMTPLAWGVFGVFMLWGIICLRKMFEKAGLPGWGSLIPIYNIVLWFKMAGRSGRRTLSILFPPLFAIILIVTYFDIAKKFGKGVGFGFGLWFLGPIFAGILAFGKAQYHK